MKPLLLVGVGDPLGARRSGVYFAPEISDLPHGGENVNLKEYYDSVVALAAFLSGAEHPEPARAVEDGRR